MLTPEEGAELKYSWPFCPCTWQARQCWQEQVPAQGSCCTCLVEHPATLHHFSSSFWIRAVAQDTKRHRFRSLLSEHSSILPMQIPRQSINHQTLDSAHVTGDEGQAEVRVLLSHVAEVLLNTIKDSLYETQKLHMQEEEDKFPSDLMKSLTIWLQNRAFHNPFLSFDLSWFLGYTSQQEERLVSHVRTALAMWHVTPLTWRFYINSERRILESGLLLPVWEL